MLFVTVNELVPEEALKIPAPSPPHVIPLQPPSAMVSALTVKLPPLLFITGYVLAPLIVMLCAEPSIVSVSKEEVNSVEPSANASRICADGNAEVDRVGPGVAVRGVDGVAQ